MSSGCVGCGIWQIQAQSHMPPPPEAVCLWGATYHLPDPLFSFLTAVTELRRLLPWVCGGSELPHGRRCELGDHSSASQPWVALGRPKRNLCYTVLSDLLAVSCLEHDGVSFSLLIYCEAWLKLRPSPFRSHPGLCAADGWGLCGCLASPAASYEERETFPTVNNLLGSD